MVQSPEGASCSISLVEHVPCHSDIHAAKLVFPCRVVGFQIGEGKIEHEIIRRPQQLSVVRKYFRCIRYAYIDVSLPVSREEYRLAFYRAVLVLRDAVAGKLLSQPPGVLNFFAVSHEGYEPFPDSSHLRDVFCGNRCVRGDVERLFPAVQEHQPVHCSLLVYERCLKISGMVPDILECGCDYPVKKQPSLLYIFRSCDYYLVHTDGRSPLHVPVESYPCASPSFEVQTVTELATKAVSLHEREFEFAVHRRLGVYPEHEGGYGSFFRVGVFRQIRDYPRYLDACSFLFPFPEQGIFPEFRV